MQSPPRPANGSNTPNAPSTAAAVSEQDITRRTTRVLRQLYHREKQWLAARTDDQAALLTQQGQLSLVEQLHYAEIAFALLRLKPCAIIDYAGDRSQLADFISHVIEPAIRDLNVLGAAAKGLASADVLAAAAKSRTDSNTAWYPRPFHLTCVRISGQLASPEVASWAGAFVLFDEMWAESAAWVSTNLRDAAKTSISEDDLARGLDYPGSLPATAEEMQYIVPVSYLGRMKSESGEWMSDRWECLTSFVVLHHQLPQVALHRIRYEAVAMFDIEMQVTMDTSLVEDIQLH